MDQGNTPVDSITPRECKKKKKKKKETSENPNDIVTAKANSQVEVRTTWRCGVNNVNHRCSKKIHKLWLYGSVEKLKKQM